MGRLAGDCFAAEAGLMPLDAALRHVAERVARVTGTERVALSVADGRILAAPAFSAADVPPFDNAAMDGFAVRSRDVAGAQGVTLAVGGRVAAGPDDVPTTGTEPVAIRIFTGAPIPAGFDAVVAQEDVARVTEAGGPAVRLPPGVVPGLNLRRAGEDIGRGQLACPAGRRLTPQDVGLLGAIGLAQLEVSTRLRVAIFSTGDEIAGAGEILGPARRHDANRPMLTALLRRLDCDVTDLGILADDRASLTPALAEAAAGHDLVVTSGGVSEGEEDHVRAALTANGTLGFWRLALKPGKPVALGVIGGAAFIGLPGNPVSAFVTFCLLGRPLIARLSGETFRRPEGLLAPSGFARRTRPGMREYLRASLVAREGGQAVELYAKEGSGLITSLTATGGLVELPETGRGVAVGDLVRFIPYESFLA